MMLYEIRVKGHLNEEENGYPGFIVPYNEYLSRTT